MVNRELMHQNGRNLFALSKELGTGKVYIPRDHVEALRGIKKLRFSLDSAFAFDDPKVIDRTRSLANSHFTVWVIINAQSQKTELYIP